MTDARSTPGGRAYTDLQKLARNSGRPVQEVFQLYVLEAFLDRLSRSEQRSNLVLKGGVLLAAFDVRRPTRDVDLQAQALSNEIEVVLECVLKIVSIPGDDGVQFDASSARGFIIRDEDAYTGVRVSLNATLETANLPFHVDVNVGDPIFPEPAEIDLPRLLGGMIRLKGYPLPLIHAEKIVTAVARGTANTRWRDFVDVVGLSLLHPIHGSELVRSVVTVAQYRGVELISLATVLEGFDDIGQPKWSAWRRKQQLMDRTPERFGELIDAFIAFSEPAVLGSAIGSQWSPDSRAWN